MTPPATAAKLGLLATLYFSQGLPFGFFTQALPAVMRQQGVSLTAIGLTAVLALPWGLKFLWAPMVERRGHSRLGRRRGWLLPLQLTSAAVLVLLALVDSTHALGWLVLGVLLTNLLAATQDIATDGLAVDLLTRAERGLGNGIQLAGYRVGMIAGGGALLVAFEHLGWTWTFTIAAGLMLLATLPLWRLHERPAPAVRGVTPVSVRDTLRWFLEPPRRRWLLVIAVYKAGDSVATSMLRPFFIDEGLGLADLGWLLGAAGFTAGLLGALAGGAAVGRIGRHRSLVAFGVAQGISVASYALATGPETSAALFYGPVVFEHFASGMATAALFTVMMDHTRPEHAASDYTLQASVVVLATGLAGALGGVTAQTIGYGPNFLLGGVVCLAALFLLRVNTEPGVASRAP